MITPDKCATYLESLILSQDPTGLVQAEGYVEDLLQASPDDRGEAARALGEVQAQLLRRTPASPLRADVADLLSVKIMRLLEPE